MPLNVVHSRGGEALKYRWGFWHLWAFTEADKAEGGNALRTGRHVFKGEHRFEDDSDGEVVTILPGDVLEMYR